MRQRTPYPFADDFMFLEAPKWRQGTLWASDVFAHQVVALSSDGTRQRVVEVPNRPSGLGFLSDGSLIIVSAKDRKLLRLETDGLAGYADLSEHASAWLNDFAVDPWDRIFVGDFGYDFVAGEARRTTRLHRVDKDGTISVVADEMDFPNGSVVVDEGRKLIVAETWEGRITAFDIAPDGALHNRRIFADLGQRQPDGLCADAEGAVWVGIYNTGEFLRVVDGGRITDRIRFDGAGISCVLGGEDGRTLFMTAYIGDADDMAAGRRKSAIFTARVEVPGPEGDRLG